MLPLNNNSYKSKPTFLSAPTSRRHFLRQAMTVAAGLIVPGLLAACGNRNTAEPPAASAACPGPEVTAGQSATRQAVAYVDKSPQADKTCANCRFYKTTVAETTCGTCEVVPGPIAFDGYCNVWAAKAEADG